MVVGAARAVVASRAEVKSLVKQTMLTVLMKESDVWRRHEKSGSGIEKPVLDERMELRSSKERLDRARHRR